MRKFFFIGAFLFSFVMANGQYFNSGQDPASIKWRQINSENFQLIYPDYYESQAQHLFQVLEKVYKYGSLTLPHSPKKISVILHTQTVHSNGLVAIAPKRSEFYTTPNQGIYQQDWLKQLAIHEFRHIVQIDKIDSEIPKIIKILLGEQGTAAVFGAYLPWWYIEGDAVVIETAISKSGRGRNPSFLMEHKALAVEKGIQKYDKAYNGSYKEYVPNHYQLGYYLVGKTREKYGSDIWNAVLNRVSQKPFSLHSFNKGLQLQTGLNKVQLYDSIFSDLQNYWINEDRNYKEQSAKKLATENKKYTSYMHNNWLNDSIIISYKTGFQTIPVFVEIDLLGNEKKLYHPGYIFEQSINYRDEWVVWSEQLPSLRWQHSGRSLIKLYNVYSSTKREIHPELKAFAPSVSPDKSKVVVVEVDFSNNYYLSIYDIVSEKLLFRIKTPENHYFFSPDWINNQEIAAIVMKDDGKHLAKFEIESGKMELLINEDLGDIKNLKVTENVILFISSYSGKNALYELNLKNKSIVQVYEPRFGVESPAISSNKKNIVLSNYTSDGFKLITVDAKLNRKKLSSIKKYKYKLADNLATHEHGIVNLSTSDEVKFDSKKYSKTSNVLNFHSWAPATIDVNNQEITPGVSFMSQNKLGTAEMILGYKYDLNERTGKFFGNFVYKGWFPIFDVNISTGRSASSYYHIEQTKNNSGQIIKQDTTLQPFTWNETNFGTNVRIPFNLSRGKYSRLLQPEVAYNLTNYKHYSSTPENLFSGFYQSATYRLYYQQLLRKSLQDVYPNLGFIADVYYKQSFGGEADFGNLSLAQAYLFLPGAMPNHGIRLYGGVQQKNPQQYSFSDVIRYPRGWSKINTTGMNSFAADYKFPLFYPEWSVWSLAYLKRVNVSLFGDYAQLNGNIYKNGDVINTFSTSISSYGAEITGDVNILRFFAPLEIGTRISYLPEAENFVFDFLFSINFTPF